MAWTHFRHSQVFHELARHLQTRRLVAGDTLNLDQDKSFYIVVDGSVQVFAQTGNKSRRPDAYDDEDDNGYQLLNNVESGGTLSSLFTILSLFTEDVKLRYEEEGNASAREFSRKANERNHDVSDFVLDQMAARPSLYPQDRQTTAPASSRRRSSHTRPASTASFGSTSTAKDSGDLADMESETEAGSPPLNGSRRPPLDPIGSAPGTPGLSAPGGSHTGSTPRSRQPSYQGESQQKEGTIARASTDTTLAVIPAEAFRRLTKKFPNAAA